MMLKRTFLTFITALLVSAAFAQVSPKRGMAYGYHSIADLNIVKPGISWWYNWSNTPDAAIANYYSSQGVEFVPMMWNDNFTVANAIAQIPAGTKYLLAYNEPNFNVEANMTPAQAAAAWYKIEQVAAAKNLQIISAAAAYCGGSVCVAGYTDPIKWHDDFFAACPTCKVDYIAFHNYEPTTGALIALTNNLKKYGRPIWVTEFAYWDPAASNAAKISYLQTAVNAFENDPDIYRYSWFTGRSTPNPSINLLGASGVLTSLGSAYIGATYGPKNNVPGKIEVEKMYRRRGTSFQATTDVGGGQNVGFTDPGTWNEYLVNVSTTGAYTIRFRLASNVATGAFDIKVDDNLVKANVTVASTGGWQTWVDYDVTGVVLPAGEHLLKFEFTGTGTNMNYFTTIYESGVAATADFSATPLSTCTGNQVVYTDLSTNKTGAETYAWNFGLGATPATASGIGPHNVTYSTGGQKTPSMTITNAYGGNTKTKTNYVTVASPPTGCLFQDDYNNATVNWINPIPGAFSHTESGTAWRIGNTGYGEWENFTYTLNDGATASPINFQCAANKPIVTIRAKASANCLLSLTMLDANGRAIDNTNLTNLELTTTYQTFTINFAGRFRNYYGGNPGILDSSNINRLQFAVNPGFFSYPITGVNGTYNAYFPGTVDIDWIGIGNSCSPPVLNAPTITSFTPNCGLAGTSVVITGTNLTGATNVSFNGTAAAITGNTATQITATAPAGVTSGTITVTTPTGTATSSATFNLIPSTTAITGPATSCANGAGKVYSVTNTSGSTYNWTVPAGASITAGLYSNSITVTFGSANGDVAVTEVSSAGCSGTQKTTAVTLTAGPAGTNAGVDQSITTSSTSVTGNTPASGSGTWSLVSGTGIIATPNNVTTAVSGLSLGTNVLRWTVTDASTCSSYDDVNLVVNVALGVNESPFNKPTGHPSDSYSFVPNPFNQTAVLKLTSEKEAKVSVKILDMKGVCWYASEHVSNENIVLGKELPSGVYSVVLQYEDTLQTVKVIKAD